MGPSNSKSNTVVNSKQHEDVSNVMKAATNIDNTKGVHNIKAGDTGVGVTIYLQNLQQTKTQLQQLGANAVYVPESNSLVLLVWVSLSNIKPHYIQKLFIFYFFCNIRAIENF